MADIKQPIVNYATGDRILPETTFDQVQTSSEDPTTLDSALAQKAEVDHRHDDLYPSKTELSDKIKYGTTDLEDGVSTLETGTLYVVYEE